MQLSPFLSPCITESTLETLEREKPIGDQEGSIHFCVSSSALLIALGVHLTVVLIYIC